MVPCPIPGDRAKHSQRRNSIAYDGAGSMSGTAATSPHPFPSSEFEGHRIRLSRPSPPPWSGDLRTLRYLEWAAALALVGLALQLPSEFDVTSTAVSVSGSLVTVGFGNFLNVFGAGFAVTGLLVFRFVFRQLRSVDASFSVPAVFALLAIAGTLGWAVVIDAIFAALTSPGPFPFLVISGLVSVVLAIQLAGLIGVAIGIWRLGTRYDRWTVQTGAVLLVLPYVGVAGAVLILLGARSARRTVVGPTASGQVDWRNG